MQRNAEVPADQDVAKRTFYNPGSPEGTIRIIYHYAAGKITRPSRTYSKVAFPIPLCGRRALPLRVEREIWKTDLC